MFFLWKLFLVYFSRNFLTLVPKILQQIFLRNTEQREENEEENERRSSQLERINIPYAVRVLQCVVWTVWTAAFRLHLSYLNQSRLIPMVIPSGHWVCPKDGRNVNPTRLPRSSPASPAALDALVPRYQWFRGRKFPRARTLSLWTDISFA